MVIDSLTPSERLRAIEAGAEVGFQHDLLVEAIVLSSAEWLSLERSERFFAREVRREGLAVTE